MLLYNPIFYFKHLDIQKMRAMAVQIFVFFVAGERKLLQYLAWIVGRKQPNPG